jgi:hypothetical protein
VPRIRFFAIAACASVLAAGLGGCASQINGLTEASDAGWFSKPMNLFSKPEWAKLSNASGDAISTGPVAQTDLVSADGQCAAAPVEAQAAAPAPATPPAAAPASAGTGFEGGLQSGPGAPAAPAGVAGGIALGMTECQAVRRAGTPTHVAITAGQGGARRVVITYLTGQWPGIYTFESGRLKVVDAAPVPERKPEPKKRKVVKRANSAAAAQTPVR